MSGGEGEDGSRDVGPAEGERAETPPRRRRWPWVVLGVLVLLVAAVAQAVRMAPEYVRSRIEARLGERFGATAEVERVKIDWGELTIVAFGVRFDDGERTEVDIACLEIDLSLDDIVSGPARPHLRVHEPVITFEVEAAEPREPAPRDAQAFSSIEIDGGRLELVVPTSQGPAFVDLSEIEARVDHQHDDAELALDLDIEARARVGGQGTLHIDGRVSSQAPAKAWSVRFELQRFELATLNQLWLDIIEMDVERGHVSLDGTLRRTPSHLQGRVRPRFEDVALLGADEQALHPMAEALFGHMLMGARSTIAIDRPMTGEQSSLPELLETDWRTLVQRAIRQGYARRLSTMRGFTASIGNVTVDLGQGLLQLYEVEVDAERPVLDVPLVTIEKVDVVFDPAVTRKGAPAYKHVTLWRPTVTFATGVEGSTDDIQFDESWVDTISAIPFPTRDLVVHEGRLELWDLRYEEPVDVVVDDIEIRAQEMARDLHRPGVRGAELSVTATVLGESDASVRVVYEPKAAVPNLDMDLRLEPLSMATLAPALRTFVGVDGISGHVGFSAHVSARNQRVEATVVPEVFRPKLASLGRGHLLRKIVIGRALRRMQSHTLQFGYAQEPGEGLLQGFFAQLIQAVFLDR